MAQKVLNVRVRYRKFAVDTDSRVGVQKGLGYRKSWGTERVGVQKGLGYREDWGRYRKGWGTEMVGVQKVGVG